MIDTKLIGTQDGGLIIQHTHDVTAILEQNKQLLNDGDGYSPSRDFKRAATIPLGVILMWKQDHGIDALNPDHWPAVKRLLNSNEWRHLRTAEGRL